MDIPEFVPFRKIPRLNREVFVTEKIDGTNAGIFIPEDCSRLAAASRSRWINPDDDNYGFAQWAYKNEKELIAGLGPGMHWGEWWGVGINRGYGLHERRFSLFNVSRWETPPPLCHVAPVLWRGPMIALDSTGIINGLRRYGSQAMPGFLYPEGIIVYHVAGNCYFKMTCEKDDERKGDGVKR